MKKYTLLSKIKKYYFGGYVIITLISIFLFGIISIKVFDNQALSFSKSILSLNMQMMDKELFKLYNIQKNISQDNQIKDILSYRIKNKNTIDYSVELYNQRKIADILSPVSDNMEILNAYILSYDSKVLYSLKHSINDRKLKKENWYKELLAGRKLYTSYLSTIHNLDYQLVSSDKNCISILVPIFPPNNSLYVNELGYLVFDIDIDYLILKNKNNDIKLGLLDNEENLYSFDFTKKELSIYESFKDVIVKSNHSYIDNYLILSMGSEHFNINIIGIKELSELSVIKKEIIVIGITIFIITIIFSLIMSQRLAQIITRPIYKLVEKCKKLMNGDYNISFDKEDNLELSILSKTFEAAINNIISLNKQMLDKEKQASKYQLQSLQHQINPHFINNVLQTIKALSIENKSDEISAITTYLGKIMAYAIYQPYKEVALQEELSYAGTYLKIQNIRYNNIFFSICCDEDFYNIGIPKLTIQPIIENSIEHGIIENKKLSISLLVEMDKDFIYIIINDNGSGMSSDILEKLNSSLVEGGNTIYNKNNSIGILNVHERLKERYGEAYGLEIHSKINVGTTTIIKLPNKEITSEGIVS